MLAKQSSAVSTYTKNTITFSIFQRVYAFTLKAVWKWYSEIPTTIFKPILILRPENYKGANFFLLLKVHISNIPAFPYISDASSIEQLGEHNFPLLSVT